MCSNSHEPVCTMFNPSWSPGTDRSPLFSPLLDSLKAIHFACALRRRPPATRPVFTADRSWFCSPECHRVAIKQRLADAVHLSSSRKDTWCTDHSPNHMIPEVMSSRNQNQDLARSVVDDMEPISLGELLVCRRVFVPSNCFVASLYPAGRDNLAQLCYTDLCDSPEILQAAYEAISCLSVSPNSWAFLRCNGLPASLLVVTVGSLRVDRLGEMREASDSLACRKSELGTHSKRNNYLCPVNYRARRIYWSCHKLDDRVSYTLHVRQMHAITNLVVPTSSTTPASLKSVIPPYSLTLPHGSSPVPCSQHNFQGNQNTTVVSVFNDHQVTSHHEHSHENGSVVDSRPFYRKPTILRLTPMPHTDRTISPAAINTGCFRFLNTACCTVEPSVPVQCTTPAIPRTPCNTTSAAAHLASEPGMKANIGACASPLRIVNTMSISSCGISTRAQDARLGTRTPPHRLSFQCAQSPYVPHVLSTSSSSPWSQSKLYAYDLNSFSRHPVSYAFASSGAQRVRPSMRLSLRPAQQLIPLTTHPSQSDSTIPQPGVPCSPPIVPGNRILTTPTKDERLACQLNGLFKNLPTVHQLPVTQLLQNGQVSYSPQLVSGPLPTTTVRVRVPHPVIPQLDGTLDDGNESDWCVNQSKRSRLMMRGTLPQWRPRSGSATSTDSSTSNRTSLSSASKRSRHTDNVCNEHLRSKKQWCPSHLPSTPQPATVRRRWIEDRNRQQELANLVSKAKQANQARLYQNEVEKHARAFRLRFSIDAIVRAAASPAVAWRAVVSRVASLRERQGLPPLISDSVDGWTQFGLSHRHVIFLVEQMRGAFQCYRYRFRYHWRKVDRLRKKFTPPVPVVEGCARAIEWSKPRRPAGHARDPLSFLHCKANPPPRPLLKSTQDNLRDKVNPTATQNFQLPNEPTALLSPNEQRMCVDAARRAASLVAAQLKVPMKLREVCVAQAVVQATGLPLSPTTKVDVSDRCKNSETHSSKSELLCLKDITDSDGTLSEASSDSEESTTSDQEPDLGTVTAQFRRLVSGSAARFLHISVHPSRIHGRGLFALRGFFEDEMVVEYMGELIRNLVCEAREVRYRAASVDCYMFRIDEDFVIDATYAGNAARFINHSCDPNCYAKVITADDSKHIVILAKRRIYPGEELTYDYRFPKESDKLLCNCGSYNCRKYLN